MHTTAIIRNVGSKYTVTSSSRCLSDKFCDSFEEAYRVACDHVNWDLEYLTVDILPDDLKGIINKVKEEHRKKILEEQVAKTYSDYLEAKKRFEVEVEKQ